MFTFTDQQFMVWTGQAMLWLLIVILLARPLHKYLKFKYLMKYRRQLGWMFGSVLVSHLGYWALYYWSTLEVFLRSVSQPWLWLGLLGACIGLLLTATSNTWAVKKLGGKKWKQLHKLTYLLPIVSILHAHLAVRGINWELLLYLVPLMLLVAWRYTFFMTPAIAASLIAGVAYIGLSGTTLGVPEVAPELTEDATLLEEIWLEAFITDSKPIPHISQDGEDWCVAQGSWPVSITEDPLYCANGARKDK